MIFNTSPTMEHTWLIGTHRCNAALFIFILSKLTADLCGFSLSHSQFYSLSLSLSFSLSLSLSLSSIPVFSPVVFIRRVSYQICWSFSSFCFIHLTWYIYVTDKRKHYEASSIPYSYSSLIELVPTVYSEGGGADRVQGNLLSLGWETFLVDRWTTYSPTTWGCGKEMLIFLETLRIRLE